MYVQSLWRHANNAEESLTDFGSFSLGLIEVVVVLKGDLISLSEAGDMVPGLSAGERDSHIGVMSNCDGELGRTGDKELAGVVGSES